jgi:transglutaminase-like putative cysteine protease
MSRRLFWDAFARSRWVKAIALALVASLFVVQCGREGGQARDLSKLNYDSLPAKAPRSPRPTTPAQKLHADVTQLKDLLAVQAKRDLSDDQTKKARSARIRIVADLRALGRQFDADRAKLEKLDGKAALARLDTIESKTRDLGRSLQSALARVRVDGKRASEPAAAARGLLTELSPPKPQQPLSSDLGFETKNGEPRPVSLSAGITPAYNTPSSTETSSDLPRSAEDEDLVATADTEATPAIRELVQQLDRDPVRIYEYVRNNISYEPYYGIRKGADQTLLEKAGSDADQAALTIALLRASGVHARFVQGVAELPARKAATWLGVDTAAGERVDAVPEILAAGGVPTTAVRANGQLAKVRFDHVWSEAYVPRDAYRGVNEDRGGRAWLPLDPAIKETRFIRPKVDLEATIGPRAKDWVEGLVQDTQTPNSHTVVPPAGLRSPAAAQQLVDEVNADVSDKFDANDTLGDLIGGRALSEAHMSYLPASTPFRPVSVSEEYRAVPAALHARVSIAVSGADPLSVPNSDPEGSNYAGFSFSASTADIGGSRITIAYVPATERDADIIDAYHGLLNAPTYAASLIPVLRVDGKVVARGHRPVSTGYTQSLAITYRMPGFAQDVVTNPLYVGSLSALALDLGFASGTRLSERAAKWQTIAPSIDSDNVLTDRYAGEAFSQLAYLYFARNDVDNAILAQTLRVNQQRSVSGGLVATDVTPTYVASFPVSTRLTGVYMDVDQDAQAVVARTQSGSAAKTYMSGSGLHASQTEGFVFDRAFGGPSASTAKVMQVAAEHGIPLMYITAENRAEALPDLNATPDVKTEIEQEVARGATVVVPRDRVTIGGWSGTGYVIDRGDSAGYRITGGANGSFWDWFPPGPVTIAKALGNPEWDVELVGCMAAVSSLLSVWNFVLKSAVGRPLLARVLVWAVLRFPVALNPAVLGAVLAVITVLLWTWFFMSIISAYTNQYACEGDDESGGSG